MTRKRQIQVTSMSELRRLVAQLIESGDTDVNVQLPLHMIGPEAYGILGQIIDQHPASKGDPDGRTRHEAQEEEEEKAEAEAEVVSYPDRQEHRGVPYDVYEAADGFRVKVQAGCSLIEPWDCSFANYEDAALHGRAYIDDVLDASKGDAK